MRAMRVRWVHWAGGGEMRFGLSVQWPQVSRYDDSGVKVGPYWIALYLGPWALRVVLEG